MSLSRNLFSLITGLCCIAFAQAQSGFSGFIRTQDDSIILSEALINLPDLNVQTLSDSTGHFYFARVPNGYYTIQIFRQGFGVVNEVIQIKDSLQQETFYLKRDPNALDEIVVYGTQQDLKSETPNNIEVMDAKTMRDLGAMNLSDGVAKLPGVSQLSTGAGISKPVIRGLFGNRIQTVLLGMRFDNQQWQDEHGLGLTDIGVDRVEVIKGAASLLYGSEAMGGVLNIINEKAAPVNKIQSDVSTRFFSNTYGYAVDAGVKRSNSKINWGIRLGSESHADYSDGNGKRILNSRFGGNLGKAFITFKRRRWISENNYLLAQNNFGFLMDAYQLYDKPDDRLARDFQRPHHTVLINMFTSQNTFLLRASKFKVNLGAHINNRQEQEGSSGISLDMLLKTYTALFQWTKNISNDFAISIGSQDQYQTNQNLGSRIIVPDANLGEASLFTYLEKKAKFLVIEGGLRYDMKSIQTLPTSVLNDGNANNPGSQIVPVTKLYNTMNGAVGLSAFDHKHHNAKLNITSGYRGPNLAELSSNGLHEGSLRYEVGDVNLKIEQNLCFDLYYEFYNSWFTVFASAYSNNFLNYIYLRPDSTDYLGFRVYKYVQENASINGFEGGLRLHPASLKFLQLSTSYSGIQGQTERHEYLPFIPAQKLNNELRLKTDQLKKLKNAFFSIGYVYVFAQNKPNQFETSTPAYQLVNASLGAELWGNKKKLLISVSGNNLLNEVYYDHLSRFKYFGIYNIGRSICVNLKFQFN